ncbi:MAG TPA: metalloregulator ArsR/SmtB family transcription factor [Actinomycetota bacterium]
MTEPAPSPSTRRAVLDLLKREGPQTVARLGEALGVSGVAVRRHLEALISDGLVTQTASASGRGRPAHVYALTEAGHDQFPRNYHQLAAQLLEAVEERFGAGALESLFERRQQVLAALYAARTHGRPLGALAAELAAIQDENGYMADWEQTGTDRYVVSEHNCAIRCVASAYPQACQHELALFQQLAGPAVEVQRIEHLQAGDSRCAYVLRPASTPTPNANGAGE